MYALMLSPVPLLSYSTTAPAVPKISFLEQKPMEKLLREMKLCTVISTGGGDLR